MPVEDLGYRVLVLLVELLQLRNRDLQEVLVHLRRRGRAGEAGATRREGGAAQQGLQGG